MDNVLFHIFLIVFFVGVSVVLIQVFFGILGWLILKNNDWEFLSQSFQLSSEEEAGQVFFCK